MEIWYLFKRGRFERLFDPYTGRDLGDAVACEPRLVVRLADLHDNLLAGDTGEAINGIGGILLTLMCLTGAVIWWPGTARWRRSLMLHRHVQWRRFVWDLHGVLGFWMLLLIFVWAVSGIYLAFPNSFYDVGDFLVAHGASPATPHRIDVLIDWLVTLHFGRAFGPWAEVLWSILGLVPAALIVTGGAHVVESCTTKSDRALRGEIPQAAATAGVKELSAAEQAAPVPDGAASLNRTLPLTEVPSASVEPSG